MTYERKGVYWMSGRGNWRYLRLEVRRKIELGGREKYVTVEVRSISVEW